MFDFLTFIGYSIGCIAVGIWFRSWFMGDK